MESAFTMQRSNESLDLELLRDKETYMQNLAIGELISLKLSKGTIPEEFLWKLNKALPQAQWTTDDLFA